jgi:uncharacterized protein (DUF2252 family)
MAVTTRSTRSHPTLDERTAKGRAAREAAPRKALADYAPPAQRDPIQILVDQGATRQQDLLPIRYGRMAASPFAFLSGAAAVMVADIAPAAVSSLRVQAVGDAHISNFGVFASPDRRLVFDVNDFDETLPAPWEWDVKRLVASVAVAGLDTKMSKAEARAAAVRAAAVYRTSMTQFAAASNLDVWYAHIDVADLAAQQSTKKSAAVIDRQLAKVRTKTGANVIGKLAEVVDGRLRFKSMPPLITPLRELVEPGDADMVTDLIKKGFEAYRTSLPPERRVLIDRYRMVDVARKVVGVGSVGTRCFMALFLGRDENDALVLQFKEAGASVLESYAGRSTYRHHGARVVLGQRMVQLAGDILLGWSTIKDIPEHYYWRQLKDMKASAEIGLLGAKKFRDYVDACAWCLARAHARSGDPVAIAAYLGNGTAFDKAAGTFALAYAGQTMADWKAHKQAIADGRVEAQADV